MNLAAEGDVRRHRRPRMRSAVGISRGMAHGSHCPPVSMEGGERETPQGVPKEIGGE